MKTPKEKLRNKADAILQEYIRTKHKGELCWHCGDKYVTVGHHYIYKSQSLSCRYYIPNLIPLCRDCHLFAHRWQNLFNTKLALKMGQEWFDDIEARRFEKAKFTKEWIETELKILKELK
jgi:5-methylcytosine-specific restriction endonuclease McrA